MSDQHWVQPLVKGGQTLKVDENSRCRAFPGSWQSAEAALVAQSPEGFDLARFHPFVSRFSLQHSRTCPLA